MYGFNVATTGDRAAVAGEVVKVDASNRDRDPVLQFVQPDLQVDAVWAHVTKLVNQTLQDLDLPLTADVDALSSPESGVAIVARRMPLIDLWRARQERWKASEAELARVTLTVGGNAQGGQRGLLAAATAELEVVYPEPQLPLPTPERNTADEWELTQGLTSRIRLVMERRGCTREQAVEYLEQTIADLVEERDLYADAGLEPGTPDSAAGKDGQDADGDPAEDDLGDDEQPIPGED
jgi:hypothetical protein